MESKDHDSKASGESQPEQGGGSNPKMMGMGMMKKMMAQMGSGGESPMAMMQKMMGQMGGKQGSGEAANPMQNMMGMCMGMQAELLSAMQTTTSMAAFATPELHGLFGDWMESLEREALAVLAQKGEVDTATLATQLKISEESVIHLVAQLARKGKVHLSARAAVAT